MPAYRARMVFGAWGENPAFDRHRVAMWRGAVERTHAATGELAVDGRAVVLFGAWGRSEALDDACVTMWLETFAQIATLTYFAFPRIRSPYDGEIAYSFEPPSRGADDEWRDTAAIRQHRRASCKSLSADRVGELRARHGIAARVVFVKRMVNGQPQYHLLVEYPDGTREDPSRALGMR